MANQKPLIAITLGDPSGIGPEVVAKALSKKEIHKIGRFFVLGTKIGSIQILWAPKS